MDKKVLTLVAAGVIAVAMLGMYAAVTAGKPDWRVTQLYGGAGSLDLLNKPRRVDAFLLDPTVDPHDPTVPRVGAYVIADGPVQVDPETASALAAILLDPSIYDWYRAKSTRWTPRIGLRFARDSSRLDLALCLDTDQILAYRHGRIVHSEDTDVARARLLPLLKSIFPDDPYVQGLTVVPAD